MHYLQEELYQQMRQGNQIFDFLREGTLDGLWYWDLENPEVEWMSPEFWRLFGVDPATMPHRADTWQDMIHPEDLETAIENFHTHLADPTHPYDQIVRYRHAVSGEYITVRCRGMAIRDAEGKPLRMLGAHTDLTELKQTEEALRAAISDLSEARVQAESSLRAKSVFLETMSHEIRTPMNGILGMAQALVQTDLPPAALEKARVINRSAQALLILLNDIMDLSRIEAGKISMEVDNFCPADIMRDAVATFGEVARAKDIDLLVTSTLDLSETFVGSARVVRQVVSNLVSNALKFADKAPIEVRGRLSRPDNKGQRVLRVEVVDRGVGIADAEKAEVFKRFSQGSTPGNAAHPGTGLGLPIARQLCEAHGGRLQLKDTPGGGATFVTEFLLQPSTFERRRMVPGGDAIANTDKPLTLLIVEDNEMNRMVIAAMLETMPVSLDFASNGLEALNKVKGKSYDAGFIDIRMPVMMGTEFAQELRSIEAANGAERMPLVACSASVQDHQVEGYLAAGFDRHLPKPITLEELRNCISWVVGQRVAAE